MTTIELPPAIIALLNGNGITIRAAAERLGCRISDARAALLAAGAHSSSGTYRIGARPPTAYGKLRACLSTPMTGNDFLDAGRG